MIATRRIPSRWWRRLGAAAIVSIAAQAFGADAQAGRSPPTPVPSEVASALPGARLLGSGTMRFLAMRIYDARLWVGSGFAADRYGTHAFALELQYARAFDGADIAQRSIEEMRRIGNLDDAQADAWRVAMKRAFPDVKPGDRLTGLHLPGGTTRFFHNGQPTQVIEGQAFARLFFGIWLAPTTSEPALRRQLVAAGA
jgi:hypothetical protein